MKTKAIKNAAPILLEEVQELKNILETFVLDGYEYEYVGSIGKKEVSSDVDVVICSNMFDFFNNHPELKVNAILSKGFNLASIPLDFKGEIIQLDIFFSEDLKWSEFILGGNRDRNQLLMAAVIVKSYFPLTKYSWEQKNIRIPSGVWYVEKTNMSTTGNRLVKTRILKEKFCSASLEYISDLIDCPIFKLRSFELLFEHFREDAPIMEKFYDYQSNNK